MRAVRIGLVGDFDPGVTAHRAIPSALRLAADRLAVPLSCEWLGTDAMPDAAVLARFDALWCVPGSPYRDMAGALRAIRFARQRRVPFLGTCAGFQYALVEYARNVLGWSDAGHAETEPVMQRVVVVALECALVEVSTAVRLLPASRIAAAYGCGDASEAYHCRFGLNPAFRTALLEGALQATAFDSQGEVRAVELRGHPFFVCTLFQPERAALRGEVPPLALAFVRAAATGDRGGEPALA